MMGDTLTPVVTAGKTDTYERLWDKFDETAEKYYKDVHYKGQTNTMSETAIDKDGNAFEIDQ